ncbi:hypothetical protein FHQ28_05585 [Pasteurellaceae bacterium USgator11]|nr:hypothetical protein FHQ20_07845 [Pasteurellaceae bacterium USgator41]TNG96469.1 hypothetical protein FHQ19_02020 [Pasteurellaceae bacterium UScroc12]TNH00449.1 hypothetical protein FHQ24_03605 [Pasteurellaceae bacterium UScroc31]TNH01720.1 hypothetical protein FHQ28_05585 [Pasteurellaceae bacterium USgator11]
MANGRCRFHGGKSTGAPKGNFNSAKPGSIYSKFFTDEEQVIADAVELDSLDQEIRLFRVRLFRLIKEEQEQGELELRTKTEQTPVIGGLPMPDEGVIETKQFVKRDYHALINQTTARLQSLISQRATLTGQKADLEIKALNLEILRSKENYSSKVLSVSPTIIELIAPD